MRGSGLAQPLWKGANAVKTRWLGMTACIGARWTGARLTGTRIARGVMVAASAATMVKMTARSNSATSDLKRPCIASLLFARV